MRHLQVLHIRKTDTVSVLPQIDAKTGLEIVGKAVLCNR
jgi:hypothetical protein